MNKKLTPRQQKVLAALLTHRTTAEAAKAAGISPRRLREIVQEPGFKAEYQRCLDEILTDAMKAAKNAMLPAVDTLREVCIDKKRSDTARIMAARSIIDAGIRLHDAVDVSKRLEKLERYAADENTEC